MQDVHVKLDPGLPW